MIHVTELMKGVETTKEEKCLNELRDNAEMEQTRIGESEQVDRVFWLGM